MTDRLSIILCNISYSFSSVLFFNHIPYILFTTRTTTTASTVSTIWNASTSPPRIHANRANVESSRNRDSLSRENSEICNTRHIERVESRPLQAVIHIREGTSPHESRGMPSTPVHHSTRIKRQAYEPYNHKPTFLMTPNPYASRVSSHHYIAPLLGATRHDKSGRKWFRRALGYTIHGQYTDNSTSVLSVELNRVLTYKYISTLESACSSSR